MELMIEENANLCENMFKRYIGGRYLHVLIIVLLLPWQLISVHHMVRYFPLYDTFVNHGFKNITSASALHCSMTCESYSSICSSVSYHGNDRTCQLNDNHVIITPINGWMTLRARCANNWIQLGWSCYLLVTAENRWSDAEVNCNSLNGHLADINNEADNQILADAIFAMRTLSAFWIGLYDPASNDELMYSSGASIAYQNYGTRQYYNNKRKRTDCFALKPDGTWGDIFCLLRKMSVCKLSMN